ncbi:hypothetical protein R1sor_027006 [Riccia sorocarpa]|uniref:SAP domain-containing protein n=1 Tax=Riccia sorocarpa TaxID=122646 RepID=A0ABD3GD16_9MARC
MTRPPRPKYPSDTKNYHDLRKTRCAHTVRLPEELLGEDRIVLDSDDVPVLPPSIQQDLDQMLDEGQFEDDGSVCSDEDIAREEGNVVADSEDDEIKPGRISATLDLWEKNKNKLLADLLRTGKPLVLYVDCRFDSSKSGFHDTLLRNIKTSVPLIRAPNVHEFKEHYGINVDDDHVTEMVILTRKQTGSSWRIETQALEQALQILEQKGLTIEEVIHDDSASVDAILTQHGILSSKDLWHKCKNIMSKFKEILQEKRRSPSEGSVDSATTIAQVAVFSVKNLKDFCRENGLATTGAKLALVQRVSVFLQLPEAGATTELQRSLKYPELAQHDLAYKLKSWIYTCAKKAAARYYDILFFLLVTFVLCSFVLFSRYASLLYS